MERCVTTGYGIRGGGRTTSFDHACPLIEFEGVPRWVSFPKAQEFSYCLPCLPGQRRPAWLRSSRTRPMPTSRRQCIARLRLKQLRWPKDLRSKASSPRAAATVCKSRPPTRSEEQTSELQSLMRNSYAVFCLKKKKTVS